MLKKIFLELVQIKQELQAIRNHLERKDTTIDFFVPQGNQQ